MKVNGYTIYGFPWEVYITPKDIRIGCEQHSIKDWRQFDDEKIRSMDKNALGFWKKHKTMILTLADEIGNGITENQETP